MNTRLLKTYRINASYGVRSHLPMIRVYIIDIELFASIVGPSPYIYGANRVQIVREVSGSDGG